ncbi:MAG: hypothetical protein MZU97_10420 [Bacillus subtilis]|nr:hypothetical protein [Bacillus subtilis]
MYSALIVAAGGGTRMHLSYNKIFCAIRGKAMLRLQRRRIPRRSGLRRDRHRPRSERGIRGSRIAPRRPNGSARPRRRQPPGERRNGLEAINNPIVFIHDAARPNLRQADLDKLKAHLLRRSRR